MFKEGSKVKVRRFKEVDTDILKRYFHLDMFKYEEAVTVVTGFESEGDVLLAIDSERDYWHPDMLIEVPTNSPGEEEMLKVNDIVRVREDLQLGKCGNNIVVDEMLCYRGDYGYILEADTVGRINCDFDEEMWIWNKEMLELVPGFKMGGKVLIKDDLKVGAMYGDVDVVVEMSVYFGKEATITYVDVDGDVYLDIDNEHYVWSLDMLIPLEEAIDPTDYKLEYARLVEDVNEYEGIIASLEEDLQQARKDRYNIIQEYNALVDKYNSLLNELMEEYIPIYK